MFTHHFAANVVRKQCTKLHQNCLSYVGDIRKKTSWSFLLWTQYMHVYEQFCSFHCISYLWIYVLHHSLSISAVFGFDSLAMCPSCVRVMIIWTCVSVKHKCYNVIHYHIMSRIVSIVIIKAAWHRSKCRKGLINAAVLYCLWIHHSQQPRRRLPLDVLEVRS